MPFLSANQQCQSTEGKYMITVICTWLLLSARPPHTSRQANVIKITTIFKYALYRHFQYKLATNLSILLLIWFRYQKFPPLQDRISCENLLWKFCGISCLGGDSRSPSASSLFIYSNSQPWLSGRWTDLLSNSLGFDSWWLEMLEMTSG